MKKVIVAVLVMLFWCNTVSANCIKTIYGLRCSPPGGEAVETMYGVVCGKGQCVKTIYGVKCSKVAQGAAVKTSYGPKCQGGCEDGRRSYCQTLE